MPSINIKVLNTLCGINNFSCHSLFVSNFCSWRMDLVNISPCRGSMRAGVYFCCKKQSFVGKEWSISESKNPWPASQQQRNPLNLSLFAGQTSSQRRDPADIRLLRVYQTCLVLRTPKINRTRWHSRNKRATSKEIP